MNLPLASLDQWGQYGQAQRRFDDSTLSAFVGEELLDIVPQMYDRLFPELDARDHIPMGTSVSPGAMEWGYNSMDKRGKAEILGANATNMPRADVSKDRKTFPIRTLVIAYGWTIEEIEAARFAGTQLDRGKAEAARRAIAELDNSILLLGDISHNLPGFLNNPATPRLAVPNGSWATATADNILADMNFITDQVWILSERTHRPNTMLLPLAQFRRVHTLRVGDTTQTVAKFFLENNGFVKEIRSLPDLATISPTGGASALVYQKDPGMLSGIVPLEFQQLEAQVWGLEVLVPTRQKSGGTVFFYPLSATFGDGI